MSPAMPLAAGDCRTICAAPRTMASTPRNIARLRDFSIRDFVIAPTIVLQLRGVGLTLSGGAFVVSCRHSLAACKCTCAAAPPMLVSQPRLNQPSPRRLQLDLYAHALESVFVQVVAHGGL